jgi:hypothetical protein
MNDTTNPTDALLDTLRARETRLMTELADAQRAHAVAIATAEARLEEVRDLMGAITRKKPGRKPKTAETIAEPPVETEELAL